MFHIEIADKQKKQTSAAKQSLQLIEKAANGCNAIDTFQGKPVSKETGDWRGSNIQVNDEIVSTINLDVCKTAP